MVIRTRLWARFVWSLIAIHGIYFAIGDWLEEPLSFSAIFFVIVALFGSFLFLVVGNTLRFTLSEKSISALWFLGIGRWRLYESELIFKWHDVETVFSVFWDWFPFQVYGIICRNPEHRRTFFIGTVTTRTVEALAYMAKKIDRSNIDDMVLERVERSPR